MCETSAEGENCRGAEGTLQVIYVGEDEDDEVTQAVTAMLNDNADHISGLVDEFESIVFSGVSTSASILPPRPLLLSSWLVAPFVAGCMLIMYGTFVLVRDRKKGKGVVYKHVEDGMNEGLFDFDDKLRSDSNIHFPIPTQKWDNVQAPDDDDDGHRSESEDYNRKSLSKGTFVMPTVHDHEEAGEQMAPLEMSEVPEVNVYHPGDNVAQFELPADDDYTEGNGVHILSHTH